MNPEAAVVRSYRISPWRRSFLWWILGPFVLLGLGILLFGEDDEKGAGLIFILLMAPWLIWWHWYLGRLRLEVSPEGIIHRHGSLVLSAPWSQIERVRVDRAREGIVVRDPMEGRAADRLVSIRGMWMSGVPFYDDEQQQLMGERRFIPIDPFAYLLRNGRLLAHLDEFAPKLGRATRGELAHQEKLRRLPKLPAPPEQQMKQFYLVLLIASLVGLGVWMAVAPESLVARSADWVMNIAVAVCLPLWALVSLWSSRNSFRSGARTLGVLFALFGVVQALFTLVVWAQLIERARGARSDTPAAPAILHPARS